MDEYVDESRKHFCVNIPESKMVAIQLSGTWVNRISKQLVFCCVYKDVVINMLKEHQTKLVMSLKLI